MQTPTPWPPTSTEERIAFIGLRCLVAGVMPPQRENNSRSVLTWRHRGRSASMDVDEDPMPLLMMRVALLDIDIPQSFLCPWNDMAIDLAVMKVSRWVEDGDSTV
jgi:hypothetical protein